MAAASPIDPDAILNQQFEMVRRGYDPLAVQNYLMAIATELRSAREAQQAAERRIADAEQRASELENITPSKLTSLLGEETMRVLDAANTAAAEIRSNAEESVARLLREAQDQASELRRESEAVLVRKTAEATEATDRVTQELEQLRQQARADAAAEVEAGRQEGRDMVTEAQRVRERMLRDLARRRKAMRQQIEQLQAGRERLMAAYDVVRETLDVATAELEVALPEAKLAAEAAQRAGDEERAEETLDQDFAELAVELDAIERADEAAAAAVGTDTELVASIDITEESEARAGTPGEIDAEIDPAASIDSADVAPEATAEVDEVEVEVEVEVEEIVAVDAEVIEVEEVVAVIESGEGTPVVKVDSIFARMKSQEPAVEDPPSGEVPAVTDASAAGDDGAEPVADDVIARRDAALADTEKNLARRIKRELSDEQNELLDAVRRGDNASDAEALLATPEAHVERYASVAMVILDDAVGAGLAFVGPAPKRGSRPAVADISVDLAAEIIAPLRERLVRGFLESDGDPDEVSDRVRSCFREWKTQRVDGACSHAVLAAFNRGVYEAVKAGSKVHWIVDEGDTASPDCEDNALAGNLVKGEAFPTGHLMPPAHPTCRCLVLPAES